MFLCRIYDMKGKPRFAPEGDISQLLELTATTYSAHLTATAPAPAPCSARNQQQPADAIPRLFNQRDRHADRRAVAGQSVRPSANSLRQARRSDDGQMILKVAQAGQEPAFDLLVCGAPLRNRTVDLLLTMYPCRVPSLQVACLTRQNASTGQRSQAPDRLSRAPFATQSATHFDLGQAAGEAACCPSWPSGGCSPPDDRAPENSSWQCGIML
jgi:hypothetical protein